MIQLWEIVHCFMQLNLRQTEKQTYISEHTPMLIQTETDNPKYKNQHKQTYMTNGTMFILDTQKNLRMPQLKLYFQIRSVDSLFSMILNIIYLIIMWSTLEMIKIMVNSMGKSQI